MELETVNDVMIACVKALGGSKVVGLRLWPELPVDKAQRKLLDCLNPERDHRLSPEQAQVILLWSRDAGYHDGWAAYCAWTGYNVSGPLTPADERGELQRQVAAMVKLQQQLLARMEAL